MWTSDMVGGWLGFGGEVLDHNLEVLCWEVRYRCGSMYCFEITVLLPSRVIVM